MIGIIGAMQNEIEILKNSLTDYRQTTVAGILFFKGKIKDFDVVITQSGVGKVNAAIATTLLINHFKCSLILNTGIAGGTNLVQTEDIVIGTRHLYHDVDVTTFGYAYGQIPGSSLFFTPSDILLIETKKALQNLNYPYHCGTILTGDLFVSETKTYEQMGLEDIMACEMEGCAVAQTATKFKTAFIVIRFISDCIGIEGQIDNYIAFEEKMARRSATICLEIVERIGQRLEARKEG